MSHYREHYAAASSEAGPAYSGPPATIYSRSPSKSSKNSPSKVLEMRFLFCLLNSSDCVVCGRTALMCIECLSILSRLRFVVMVVREHIFSISPLVDLASSMCCSSSWCRACFVNYCSGQKFLLLRRFMITHFPLRTSFARAGER